LSFTVAPPSDITGPGLSSVGVAMMRMVFTPSGFIPPA
jgi:hypothetical protein